MRVVRVLVCVPVWKTCESGKVFEILKREG